MEFIIPHLERKHNPAGTYKILFNDKWFYIGSSKKLKTRFRTWKGMLTNPKYLKNINIKQILLEIVTVKFEILRVYADVNLIQKEENRLLKKHWNNPLLLNRCPEAETPKGLRPYNGQVRKKDIKRRPVGWSRKSVAHFINGEFFMIHESILAASNFLKCKTDPIRWILQGNQKSYKGNTFKQVDKNGSFIEPPPFVNKTLFGKRVIQLDKSGNFVAEHISVSAAAAAIGGRKRNLKKVLRGQYRYKTCMGYIFKYA